MGNPWAEEKGCDVGNEGTRLTHTEEAMVIVAVRAYLDSGATMGETEYHAYCSLLDDLTNQFDGTTARERLVDEETRMYYARMGEEV